MTQSVTMKPIKFFTRLNISRHRSRSPEVTDEVAPEMRFAAEQLRKAKKIVVLSGAGMSAESGIATFRSKVGGLWQQFDPSEVATPAGFKKNPLRVLEWHQSMRDACLKAKPNAGHLAIAEMEKQFPEVIVITQNIDQLHQRAGSRFVLEIHGRLFQMKGFCDPEIHAAGKRPIHCPVCHGCTSDRSNWRPEHKNAIVELTEITIGQIPRCPHCLGPLRPDVIWFNEGLDPYVLDAAWRIADECDVMLVVGASLQVQPAAGLPFRAAYRGATVIEINPEPAEATGFWSVRIRELAATAIPELLKLSKGDHNDI